MQELLKGPLGTDLAAAAIFLAAACAGLAKGFYRQIMPLVVLVLSGIGATVLSATLTAPVTELVYPKVVEALVRDEGSVLDFAALLQDAAGRLEPLVPDKLLRDLDEAERSGALFDTVTEIISGAADNVLGQAVDSAVDGAVRVARMELAKAIAVRLSAYVRAVLLFVLWVVLMAVLTAVKNTLGLAAKLPVIKPADRLGGAVLGLLECALAVWCLAWADRVTGLGWLARKAEGTVFLRLFL